MKRVAILSDTHGLLRDEVKEELKKSDFILHAGDINTQAIVDEMRSYAPLYIVRGNNDKEWAAELPESLSVTLEGVRFFMIHNKKQIPRDLTEVDVIVYGHSHKYEEKEENGVFMLNPGSCGKRRFDLEITMAVMTISDGNYSIEKILLNH
ncbi:MAG: metallophosphoesterase family protein [bacterium]|nr:metallophosphoesterase family protein [bacterium]